MEVNEVSNEFVEEKKPKQKIMIVPIILGIMAGISISIGIVSIGQSKNVLLQSFGQVVNDVSEVLKANDSEFREKLISSDKLTINGDVKLESEFGNYSLNYSYSDDKKDKKNFIDLDFLVNDQQLIGGNILSSNDKIYFKLKKFMDIYYYSANEYKSYAELMDAKSIDYSKITDVIIKDIKNNIDKKDIVSEQSSIKVDTKEIKVTKLTYSVTEEKLNKIALAILEDFKSEDVLNELVKVYSKSRTDLIKEIDEMIKSIKESKNSTDVLFDYNVYYKGLNKILKYEIASKDETFGFSKNEDIKQIDFSSKDGEGINIKFKGKDLNYTIDGEIINGDSKISVNGDFLKTEENTKINISLTDGKESYSLNGTIKVLDKESGKTNSLFTLKNNDTDLLKITMNTNVNFKANIDDSVLAGAKDYSKITDEEMAQIQTRIMSDPTISLFIQSLFGGFNSTQGELNSDMNAF